MNTFNYLFQNTSALEKPFLTGNEEISFRDLYTSCLNIASWIEKEVGRGRHIFLISVNNLFFIKTYLAIIKSGNVCIPLDPSIEEDNFKFISGLTHPSLVFVNEDIEKKLPVNDFRCIKPGQLIELERENVNPGFSGDENPESCAEIIFTSGSTGKPKGVMISHKNIIANTASIVDYLQLTGDDRILVVLPFYYCYGLSLLHTHLRVGGSIVFNNAFIFLGGILKNLLDFKCTGFAGVPSHFQILLRKSDSFKESKFPDLKYVTQAGGKLAPIFIDEFREFHPDIRFIVMYGQTEATARLSWLPPELWETKKGSMGKGIPGVELKVVDANGELIKPGDTGEVIARGDNIMMGYFADEEGTRNAIRDGWLYTGDLGTVDEEGYIYLTARKKEIIKVGGKRISPQEIEAVILQIPGVVDCSIEGIEDEIHGEALKVTVVVNKDSDGTVTEDYIKQHCAKQLALYKVPHFYEMRDRIIMSATGKKTKNI
ncbi:MAG: AMP-binding protein [Bacteroidales bacterium]|nr:AMP-binding protein [Bacteroidales bacterium]